MYDSLEFLESGHDPLPSTSPAELAVDAVDLRRRHGDLWAVNGVTLQVPLAGRHALIGPNGAGKTTVMRMVCATLAPHGGTLRVLGHDALAAPRALKSRIGVVPQGMTYDNEITVRENMTSFGRYHGLGRALADERADELIESMGLTNRARAMPATLSGGMQRRLLIARALMNRPRLLLLDEPTTGLDPESRHLLWDLLDDRCADGMSLLFTTHYLEEVSRLCDSLTLLRAGRVEWTGDPAELTASTVPPYVAESDAPDRTPVPAPVWNADRTRLRTGRRVRTFSWEPAGLVGPAGHSGSPAVVRPSTLEDALDARAADRLADGAGSGEGTTAHEGTAGSRDTGRPSRIRRGSPRRTDQAASLTLAAHVWHRNLVLFRKSYRTTIVPNFFEPVIMLLALGAGLGSYIPEAALGSSYLLYVAPGLLAVTAMNGAVFEVTYNVFVRLRHARSYDAAVTTPVEPPDIALGEILWAMTRCAVYTAVFLGVLAASGQVTSAVALLAVPCLLPLGLVFACAGLLFTSSVTAINAYSYFYTLVLTPLTMLSGVFFPVSRLPLPLRAVAEVSPLQHGVALSRELVARGQVSGVLVHLGYLLALAAVLTPLALRSLRRRLLV
ncbi:ABC transporter ATP-binding protein/permease [Streptomyces sp. NPDC090106]|uniref:ABC transporter ATP-binding protein/permease n=1 Tax=Streptomyces sp. NPDC090106 TaxID=3365946 RepID=UPI0038061F7D